MDGDVSGGCGCSWVVVDFDTCGKLTFMCFCLTTDQDRKVADLCFAEWNIRLSGEPISVLYY